MIAQIYYQLSDEPQEALECAKIMADTKRKLEPYERVYSDAHQALLAHEVKENELETSSLEEIRALVKDQHDVLEKREAGLTEVLTFICDLLDDKDIDEDHVAAILKQVDVMSEIARRNYAYLTGRALEFRSEGDSADNYYRLAIAKAPFDKHCVNLAGHRLALRHGTSRP